jgi:DNA polymerase
VDIANVTKELRQIGKTLALACGYAGGVGAIVTFALSFGIDLHDLAAKVLPTVPERIYQEAESFYEWLDEMDWKAAEKAAKEAQKDWHKEHDAVKEDMPEFSAKQFYTAKSTHFIGKDTFIALDSLKRLWRESHPKTVDFWAATEQAVRDAILCPNRNMYFGNGLHVRRTRNWTKIVLPSGHVIPYPNMEIGKDGTLQFMGVDQFSKKWTLVKTFGGRLVENIVQAFSRDIFKHHQLLAEEGTHGVVMPLHDELVVKVPEDSDFGHEDLERIMATNPPWALDIPLAAEGWEDTRYHK